MTAFAAPDVGVVALLHFAMDDMVMISYFVCHMQERFPYPEHD